MPDNPFIGAPDLRAPGTAVSASSEQPDYPASQLLTPYPSDVWRSGSRHIEDTRVTLTLPKALKVPLVVFGPHNLSTAARYRITLWHDEVGGTMTATSGWLEAWRTVYTADQVDWTGGNFWGRKFGPDEIAGYPWWRWWRAPAGVGYARVIQLEIDDRLSGADYVQIGMIVPFGVIDLPDAYEVGGSIGFAKRSTSVRAEGGTRYYRRRPKGRQFRGVIPYLPRDIALGGFLDSHRRDDCDRLLFWCPRPDDPLNEQRLSFIGTWAEGSGLLTEATAIERDSVPLEFDEVI